ncbi:hypothetical protein NCS55_01479200 [Fusarium keratoplasticum]|nr:hypothetical protein NCS55_01479200 [Fusarium keratoplasticum]
MVFHPPSWVPELPFVPPDSIPIVEFMSNEAYGRRPLSESRHPFTCGITGRTYSATELFQRSEYVARSLAKRLGWEVNQDTAWNKVVAIFSLNTVDFVTAIYGVHRLSGIVTPVNAASSVAELAHQLKSSGARALVTCAPLAETAFAAARSACIPDENIFLFDIPGMETSSQLTHRTIESLVKQGSNLPELDPLRWVPGQGARQPAFLCYSSGTSGLPKAVMISHANVIANVLQHVTYDSVGRARKGVETQAVSGFLPFSHIYGLVIACHTSTWRGDEVIVLPKFELKAFLESIQRFKIRQLLLVPPIIIRMLQLKDTCAKYDLSSVKFLYSGAAPLAEETMQELKNIYPGWTVGQAYGQSDDGILLKVTDLRTQGMTETATVVSSPSEHDIFMKASGSLLPGTKAKIVDTAGKEITGYDCSGELLVQAPSVVLGYLNNEKATTETFVFDTDGRWIRTGDEALFTLAPSGNEQLVIVDRIKELIKVKVSQISMSWQCIITSYRVIKLPLRSSKRISSRILLSQTAQ